MPLEDDAARNRNPNTVEEIEAALGFYCQAARAAAEVGNDLLNARRHRQIDDLLAQRELLLLEQAMESPFDRLLARVTMPKAG